MVHIERSQARQAEMGDYTLYGCRLRHVFSSVLHLYFDTKFYRNSTVKFHCVRTAHSLLFQLSFCLAILLDVSFRFSACSFSVADNMILFCIRPLSDQMDRIYFDAQELCAVTVRCLTFFPSRAFVIYLILWRLNSQSTKCMMYALAHNDRFFSRFYCFSFLGAKFTIEFARQRKRGEREWIVCKRDRVCRDIYEIVHRHTLSSLSSSLLLLLLLCNVNNPKYDKWAYFISFLTPTSNECQWILGGHRTCVRLAYVFHLKSLPRRPSPPFAPAED